MFESRSVTRGRAQGRESSTGREERRVVAEVAFELRISPKFNDDGTPEGTCERPVSIHLDEEPVAHAEPEEEGEEELDLAAPPAPRPSA